MPKQSYTFTSESVCAGHPDKICDRISDAILDAVLEQDPNGRTAIETVAGNNRCIILGEVNTTAKVDFEAIARREIRELGYTNPDWQFSDQTPIEVLVHEQSPEIAQGVDAMGAGDQGMMFGYACTETPELMPMPIMLAHQLARRMDEVKVGELPYLRPDGKSQVTVRYEDGKPVGVDKVVLANPHDENVKLEKAKADLYEAVVVPSLAKYGMTVGIEDVIFNGTGAWHVPGPTSDAGLTGRKIVVDTYGGYARVGGGAFSGKDPSKVDRSGAYAARYIAKNIVAAGLAERAEVRLAYVIGQARPLMQEVETFGTAKSSAEISEFVVKLIDTSVGGIIERLELRRPVYKQTAAYGHFGSPKYAWEQLVKL